MDSPIHIFFYKNSGGGKKKESLKFAVETSGIYEASKDFSCKSPEGYS